MPFAYICIQLLIIYIFTLTNNTIDEGEIAAALDRMPMTTRVELRTTRVNFLVDEVPPIPLSMKSPILRHDNVSNHFSTSNSSSNENSSNNSSRSDNSDSSSSGNSDNNETNTETEPSPIQPSAKMFKIPSGIKEFTLLVNNTEELSNSSQHEILYYSKELEALTLNKQISLQHSNTFKQENTVRHARTSHKLLEPNMMDCQAVV